MIWVGLLGFALFFFSDLNDWLWRRRFGRFFFPAGAALLAVATAGLALSGRSPLSAPWGRWLTGALAAAFLWLMLTALFRSMPVSDAYRSPGRQRAVYTGGMYALCRHPGVLWFIPLYLCLWLSCGLPLSAALLYSGCNLLLILLEDRAVFPALLSGYPAYRQNTPFLIPSAGSIRQFRKNLQKARITACEVSGQAEKE